MPATLLLSRNSTGDAVAKLHEQLEKLGLKVPEYERKEKLFGVGTEDAIRSLQVKYGLPSNGRVDEDTAAAIASAISDQQAAKGRVEGRIFFDNGVPAGGIGLRLYFRTIGAAIKKLGEAVTTEDGYYQFTYDAPEGDLNLEVRGVDPAGKEAALGYPKFGALKNEVLNLVAPLSIRALQPELQRLMTDLEPHVARLGGRLGNATESGDRQDFTLLYKQTGWDARLMALAARADKLSTELPLSKEALYAMFRAGMPTEKEQLAVMTPAAVEKALTKASASGIVALGADKIKEAKAQFEKFAVEARSGLKVAGTPSTFGNILDTTNLDGAAKSKFLSAYFNPRSKPSELWAKAKEAGLQDGQITVLKTVGKLAYLTFNNAPLVGMLRQEIADGDLAQLVDKDLHDSAAWNERIKKAAGADPARIDKLVPEAYTGEKSEDRLQAYSEDLARMVRLSYPTRVMARMLETHKLKVSPAGDAADTALSTFLKKAEGAGYKLGSVPISIFVKENDALFAGMNAADKQRTVDSLKRLQRLYQITPSNEALKVLLDLGFNSAHDVTKYPIDEFLRRHGKKFKSELEAKLVYRKSEFVQTTVYTLFTTAQKTKVTAPVFALSLPPDEAKKATDDLIKRFPTMESLFGSMDFCECEHCRSVLSPAAYFVDILRFLDRDKDDWKNFIDDWQARHNAPYPFLKAADFNDFITKWRTAHPGQPDPDTTKTPYEILVKRRPDLPTLPLSCENTLTALPYIDVVNEILEYFVAHDSIDNATANDTGTSLSADLLAEPQNIVPEAYDKLGSTNFPPTLPFDYWIESVRRFFDHFEMSLWRVMEVFRQTDNLLAQQGDPDPKPYYRAAVFAESLGLSPAEYSIFTKANPEKFWFELYGFSGANADANALVELKSAKTMSRRLGVTYRELIDVVRTGFVNPKLESLALLHKFDVDVEDVLRYKAPTPAGYKPFDAGEKQAFEARLAARSTAYKRNANFAVNTLNAAWNRGDFNGMLVLADPNASCNFDLTTFRRVTGDATRLDFHRVSVFIRLWKKLGWSIEETDRALQTFLPKGVALSDADFGGAMETALIYLGVFKMLSERLSVGKDARQKLLTFWARLTTTGRNPLYAQLFLTPSVLKNDDIFEDPVGDYFSTNPLLKDHFAAVQAGLNLTDDEVNVILVDNNLDPTTVRLSIDTLSLLYRYRLLSRAVGLSVRDVILLKQMSGVAPFRALEAGRITTLAQDYPFVQTFRFAEVAEALKASGFSLEDLDYLLRHRRTDPVGTYRRDEDAVIAFLCNLASGIRRIREENAMPSDAMTLTDDMLRQKLSLALGPDVLETFWKMWTGAIEYRATAAAANALDPKKFEGEEAIRVPYNQDDHEQSLVYRGVLSNAEKTRLNTAFPSPVLAKLLDDVQEQAKSFVEKNLQFSSEEPPTGFLLANDFEVLFATTALSPADRDNPASLAAALKQKAANDVARRRRLGERLLPYLQQKITRQLAVQTLATALGADPQLIETLMTDTSLLGEPSDILSVFADGARAGVDVEFFKADRTSLGKRTLDIIQSADTIATDLRRADNSLDRPNDTSTMRFDGYLTVRSNGSFRFYVSKGANMDCELRFAHEPDPLIRGKNGPDPTELSAKIDLKSGVSYRFTFEASNLAAGEARLLVKATDLPKGPMYRLDVYPASRVDRSYRGHVLLSKAIKLVSGFALTEREVDYILSHRPDFGINLSDLPVVEKADATGVFAQFRRLSEYARLRQEVAGGTADLISIFENASRSYPPTNDPAVVSAKEKEVFEDVTRRFADLTRRDVETVRAAARHLGFVARGLSDANRLLVTAAGFDQEKGIARMWEVLQIVEQLGTAVADIAEATKIVGAKTWQDKHEIARRLKNAVKSHYQTDTWRRVAQSIFDPLRQKQRDALVAYMLDRLRLERIEQLFEAFLVDAAMEPVVQTSRIQLAIASVQLFIERCFLNLEPDVHPSALEASHWEWMKRYRVWEANRKIFLYPENWLEAEFRDDKTHLFKDLEGALLQGDVSNDLAEEAFFRYMTRLEELARLEFVTSYLEEKPADPASDVLHVIGRTYAKPHKYFYRRYAHQMWTPWEPVSADIDGDHVAIALWRDRLHLFWVTFLEKPETPDNSGNKSFQKIGDAAPPSPRKHFDSQLSWIEYVDGEWSTPRASGFMPGGLIGFGEFTTPDAFFVHVTKEYDEDGEEASLRINIDGMNHSFILASKNSPPMIAAGIAADTIPYGIRLMESRTMYRTIIPGLQVRFAQTLTSIDGGKSVPQDKTEQILAKGAAPFSVLFPDNPIDYASEEIAGLVRPFFYQGSANTFFVEPTLTEKTVDLYEEWGVETAPPERELDHDQWWQDLPVIPEIPHRLPPPVFVPLDPDIDPHARYSVNPKKDWVTDPATVLKFGDGLIGRRGGVELTIAGAGVGAGEVVMHTFTDEPGSVHIPSERDVRLELRAGGEEPADDVAPGVVGHNINVIGSRGMTTPRALDRINGRRLNERPLRGFNMPIR
jgi:peptidoglycan hydrolase-like protein with peptidoglycan-binding domain